ncbi:MAG: ASKHA domain-containing protein [Treponema sp.]|jgi:uncharacterized 2Fe-2S/4Fe-4S cluster protein (DUF4445 family)|nr:ASKHA domain-containing protein [Treponema sp.]
MPSINFINENINVDVNPGVSILEAARSAGIVIESPCNAVGTCGKCKVKIPNPEERRFVRSEDGLHRLSKKEQEEGYVLACRSYAAGDVRVLVKDYAKENSSLKILKGGNSFSYERSPFIAKKLSGGHTEVYGGGALLGKEQGDTCKEIYGVAVDIGTTTLVAALVDLATGKEFASESALNPQTRFAQDVLSRIQFAGENNGLATLQQVFIDALNEMINSMAKTADLNTEHIYEVVYSGNTTMLHLACAEDPVSLGQYPYVPKIRGGNHVSAQGLSISPFGLIYLPPIISAYVGADIVSGILVSHLEEVKGTTVFIDVGTNGELVLARDGKLAASSTAAGPAFEGMNITCGMRASKGSVESFHVNDDGSCTFKVIGSNADNNDDVKATGICGSGLLDIAGELVRTGVIGKNGRIQADGYNGELKKNAAKKDGKDIFSITGDVYLAQKDIRQVQLAKGAIRTGIEMLLAHFNITASDVDSVEIAGSFGYHLNENSLISIGLLSPAFAGKVRFVGNTSMTGAVAFLLNTGFREKMKELVKRVDTVELANDPAFERIFVGYLGF